MASGQRTVEKMEGRLMFGGIYAGRRVLVTGHTGFKGSWLCRWLLDMGADVAGYSLDIPTQPSNFEVMGLSGELLHLTGDIRDRRALTETFDRFRPEMVFHLAAQSLVRRSYESPTDTFETNAMGTMNVLECLRTCPKVRAAVIITSDKCYHNNEWVWGYRENDRLGGDDPYSASKACAELICAAYMRSYFRTANTPHIATTRAGNVIGGGDWAKDRIVPDGVRAWSIGQAPILRHPDATRPWQHVIEPLSGYLWLGAQLWLGNDKLRNDAFNFGPVAAVDRSVADLIAAMGDHWEGARWEIDRAHASAHPESTLLRLACDKAMRDLQWRAILPFAETVRFTAEWYRHYYRHGDMGMRAFTQAQIAEYTARASAEALPWAN
jgi:CDP-glucose 4,6-dehydratase